MDFHECHSESDWKLCKILLDEPHEGISIRRCDSCGAFWLYRFKERVNFSGEDNITDFYISLQEWEAEIFMGGDSIPEEFVFDSERRVAFVIDEQGVRTIDPNIALRYQW